MSTSTTNVTPLTNAALNAPAPNSTAASGNSSSNSALNKADFLNLLVAQMKNQDPTSPTDSTTFVTQLAQFSQLDSAQQLNSSIATMLLLQGLTQGTNLIGKTVTYTQTGASQPSKGTVSGLTVVGGNVQLQVGSNSVPLSQITAVTNPS